MSRSTSHLIHMMTAQIGGMALFPGAAFFELATVAKRTVVKARACAPAAVTHAAISTPFRLPSAIQSDVVLCCHLDPITGSCSIQSQSDEDRRATLHMTGMNVRTVEPDKVEGSAAHKQAGKATPALMTAARAKFMAASSATGAAAGHVCSEVERPIAARSDGYRVHPGALDSALQLGQLCVTAHGSSDGALLSDRPSHRRHRVRVSAGADLGFPVPITRRPVVVPC